VGLVGFRVLIGQTKLTLFVVACSQLVAAPEGICMVFPLDQ
jgi:hypothetical protein